MGRTAASLTLLVAFAAALAACSDSNKSLYDANPNILPADYRREILLILTTTLDDPTNIRDAAISDPMLRSAGKEQRYTVCVRLNVRDASHAYTGVKERIAYFYAGRLNQLVEANEGQCANAAYKPWPELEKYCLAKSCT